MKRWNGTITIYGCLIAVAVIFVAVCASKATVAAENAGTWRLAEVQNLAPTLKRTVTVGVEVQQPTTVVRTRPARVFVARPAVVRSAAVPLTLEKREAPAYSVVETPKSPVVVRGIFTDRVRVPRGKNLSIEVQ